LIADSTYVYIDKSADSEFQRITYSDQKKRHFVRPFTVCCADGFIVDLFGPYAAVNNDAQILLEVLDETIEDTDSSVPLSSLLRPDDFLILDRGFRDCVKTVRSKHKLNVRMPTSKNQTIF
jgi:hypothetical protein